MKRIQLLWFLLIAISFGVAGSQLVVATDSSSIRRADTLPASTPWNLDELSKSPEFEWGEGKEVRSLFYKGQPYRGKPTRVFAYYATPGSLAGDPSLDKDLPAIVLVHGGGGTAFAKWAKMWAERGYAAIAMDLGVRGPAKQTLADGGPRPMDKVKFAAGEPTKDQWTYHAVADVIRAHSLIRSFKEVDSTRTAITGISWGGYLTCSVAGLDNRFKAAVPVYGCGFLHRNSAWRGTLDSMTPKDRARWIRLWDPSMYVGSATMPMLFVNGGTDFAYPPDSHAQTYALVTSPKKLHFVPHMRHGHIFHTPKAIEVFIDHHLKGGKPLPTIGSVSVGKEKVTVPVNTKTKLVKAELHYTTDKLPGKAKTRKWLRKPAIITQNLITADLPPSEATVWFLTLVDERDTLVSSTLVFSSAEKGQEAGDLAAETTLGSGKHLFILSGQSNMVGLDPTLSFTPAVASAFGKDNIIVVKDAHSGQSIRSWCKSNHEFPPPTVGRVPKVRGLLYESLMKKVQSAIEGETIQTITFVWMQGESDLRNTAYDAYLKELLKQLQEDLKFKDINFVIGRISDCGLDQKKRLDEKKYIRRTQVQFAKSYPRGAWVDTDDLNDRKQGDKVVNLLHYTAEGYKALGQRFAEQAVKLIQKVPQP